MLIVIEKDSVGVGIKCLGIDMCIETLEGAAIHIPKMKATPTAMVPMPNSSDAMIMYRAASLTNRNASTYPRTSDKLRWLSTDTARTTMD